MVRQNSASESTQNNSQNPALNTNGLTHHVEWTEEQQETLRFLLEEQVANEEYYSSLDEPHGVSCNCTECN